MGGLGSKAALLLVAVAGGAAPAPLRALRALLQPADLAALVHIALLASHAEDLVRHLPLKRYVLTHAAAGRRHVGASAFHAMSIQARLHSLRSCVELPAGVELQQTNFGVQQY